MARVISNALKAHVLACKVVHADETPVAMLAPGTGKTHRAYLWAYAAGAFEPLPAVVYDFTESRAGEHARAFLGDWRGSLVCDDYTGYKASFALGVTEAGCMAHARRKFIDLQEANKSTIAAAAIDLIGQLYGIEREVRLLGAQQRLHERRTRAAPIAKALRDWLDYDSASGELRYDADGAGSGSSPVVVAVLGIVTHPVGLGLDVLVGS